MAKMKDALFDVLEQSADDEGLDSIDPSPEAAALADEFAVNAGFDGKDRLPLSPADVRRFAVGIDRFFETAVVSE